jgi:hypothetical protein
MKAAIIAGCVVLSVCFGTSAAHADGPKQTVAVLFLATGAVHALGLIRCIR